MVRLPIGVLLAAFLPIAGCEWNEYELQLRPEGDSLQRDLTAWRDSTSKSAPVGEEPTGVRELPSAERGRIAAVYGQKPLVGDDKKLRYSGSFRGEIPNDLGGSGTFTRYSSPLGDFCVYLERVRGSDDLAADLDARRAALNRIVDIIAGWLADELKNDPIAPKMHALIDGPVRRDATNLLVDVWSTTVAHRNASLVSNKSAQTDLAARSIQYLIEHGYATPENVPRLTGAFGESSIRGNQTPLLEFGRELVMQKLSIEDRADFDRVVALLADSARTTSTFRRFIRTTPEFAAAVRRAEEKAKKTGASAAVSPDDVFVEIVARAFLPPELLTPRDRLRARLHVTAEPFATNGKWDKDEKVVRWDDSIDPHDAERPGLPLQLYAAWTEPSETGQTRQFGKVILGGEAMAKYVFWYRCLSDEERKQWDELLATLRPNEDVQVKIRQFRFRADFVRDRGDLAQIARDVLLPALREHEIR